MTGRLLFGLPCRTDTKKGVSEHDRPDNNHPDHRPYLHNRYLYPNAFYSVLQGHILPEEKQADLPGLPHLRGTGGIIPAQVFLCKIYFHRSQLPAHCRKRPVSPDPGSLLSGPAINMADCGRMSPKGTCFASAPMGIHHAFTYNIRIKNVKLIVYHHLLRIESVKRGEHL